MTGMNPEATPGRALDASAAAEQPMPTGDGELVIGKVHTDLDARAEEGLVRYGAYLRTYNGRDALLDAYQEALDLVMYLAQELMEREAGASLLSGYWKRRRAREKEAMIVTDSRQ